MERAAKVRSDIFGVSHPVNMSALSLKSEFTLFHDFVNTPSCLQTVVTEPFSSLNSQLAPTLSHLSSSYWQLQGNPGGLRTHNHFHNILRLFDVNQTLLSPQVKRCAIITYKHDIYELPHDLPNDPRPRIPGNQETLGKCPNPTK